MFDPRRTPECQTFDSGHTPSATTLTKGTPQSVVTFAFSEIHSWAPTGSFGVPDHGHGSCPQFALDKSTTNQHHPECRRWARKTHPPRCRAFHERTPRSVVLFPNGTTGGGSSVSFAAKRVGGWGLGVGFFSRIVCVARLVFGSNSFQHVVGAILHWFLSFWFAFVGDCA